MTKKNFFLLEMNLEYEKMDFPLFLKKKFFKVDMKISQEALLAKKIFVASNESRR